MPSEKAFKVYVLYTLTLQKQYIVSEGKEGMEKYPFPTFFTK